jgi:glycosyltransferase involved in cell wall biosynthesis
MNRVLIIAYFYPPLQNSGTQRPLQFSKYLPQFGWNPIVLTVENPPDVSAIKCLAMDIPKDVEVFRAPLASDLLATTISYCAPQFIRERIKSSLSWRLRAAWNRPDEYASWFPTVIRKAKELHRRFNFHLVFATGFPWTSLLAGRSIAKAVGIPFIADFRDPWTADDLYRNNVNGSASSYSRKLEHSILSSCAAVVTATESLSQLFHKRLLSPIDAPIVTIENGYDPSDFFTPPPPKNGAKKRIVYTGVWKYDYGPGLLYDAIVNLKFRKAASLANLEVICAGFQPGHAAQQKIDDIVSEKGLISHSDAITLMRSADLLYLPMPSGVFRQIALPGKVFEYAASHVPILAMADANTELSRLIDRIGGAISIKPSIADIEEIVLGLCSGKSIDVTPLNHYALKHYSRIELTQMLADIFSSVTV